MNDPDNQGHESKKQQDATGTNLKNIKISIDSLASQIDAQRREQKEGKKEDHKWPRRTAIAAIAYTVITFIVMCVASYQTYLIRSNNVISERAFVSVDYAPVTSLAVDAKTKEPIVVVQIPLVNSGNTATKDLKLFMRCAPSTDPLPEPWVLLYRGAVEKSRQILAPRQTGKVYCTFPRTQIEEVRDGKLHAYIMGEMTYYDRLDPSVAHHTQFDWEFIDINFTDAQMIPNTQTVLISAGISMSAQLRGEHNCADEECPEN